MSHFSVLVIGEDVEGQLRKYDEDINVPEYCEGEVSKKDMESFLGFYAEKNEKESKELKTFSKIYERFGRDWNGEIWREEKGVWKKFSTYNPLSRWDWYEIGGRWKDKLLLKNGTLKNSAVKSDIDFETIRKEYNIESKKKYIAFKEMLIKYPKVIEKIEGKIKLELNEIECLRKIVGFMYSLEDTIDFSLTEEEYIIKKEGNAFSTFAIVEKGEWVGKGDMGWFGSYSEDIEKEEWNKKFKEKIDSLPADTLLTIVDCHI